jgi:prepilin-type N-terminal cleavage/methylation domain-containing protein
MKKISNFKFQISNSERGFTVIEMIIAIFILSVAIIGVFSALSVTVVLTANASDRLTGAYLAQEGIEIVRNIRDNNWLAQDLCLANPEVSECAVVPGWLAGIYNADVGGEQHYQVDYKNGVISLNNSTDPTDLTGLPGCDFLGFDSLSGFYSYSSNQGSPSRFMRKISLKPLEENQDIMRVIVEVYWRGKASVLGDTSGSIIAEETLYNWYKETPAPVQE